MARWTDGRPTALARRVSTRLLHVGPSPRLRPDPESAARSLEGAGLGTHRPKRVPASRHHDDREQIDGRPTVDRNRWLHHRSKWRLSASSGRRPVARTCDRRSSFGATSRASEQSVCVPAISLARSGFRGSGSRRPSGWSPTSVPTTPRLSRRHSTTRSAPFDDPGQVVGRTRTWKRKEGQRPAASTPGCPRRRRSGREVGA